MKQKKGILLANLGTPDKPEKKEVRAFLKLFLADKRVIDTPRYIWLPILHGIILNTRPKKSAKLYKEIWRPEGSPLLIYTKEQTRQLQERFPDVVVRFGMSYSHPSIVTSLTEMDDLGVTDLTIIPLYPQYSTTTTASIYDAVATYYLKKENIPSLHFIREFTEHPLYIDLLVDQIKTELAKHPVDHLLFSYHGIPVSYAEKGDPYPEQCAATTKAVMAKLKQKIAYSETYQSKFGPAEWLTPATDATLKRLPIDEGVKKIMVITPGFVSDCLETIEEIESENRGYFMENGGEEFYYIHPFNEDPRFVDLLAQLVSDK
ncbi:ferrochelatase [Carnobacterium maltaromaticum]|uniref:ferrochelatase n=1 Tax=Carnobacterium TaxID=2747 RepID=UPI000C7820C4|nr:ferrochelatase [Carnobacterium maltaromaticum]PLS39227.1 ferrochelatase [Carnobacterium maltaromaticum]PLS40036.1 ferrochelatase [Carnobacterium maltaromaticum]PLS40373.1 ferrochelatase [Carnobacterium maltaromaticum]PLS47168.1 ferrochelatase [Carnobacterium maltaromaticum]PLS53633.1 ferrochelatase [Carnobacterium maltaromaticum]